MAFMFQITLIIGLVGGALTLRAQQSPCYEFVCGSTENYMCGSDGVTYLNGCEYSQAQCKNSSLYVVHPGPCEETGEGSESGIPNEIATESIISPSPDSSLPSNPDKCQDPFCPIENKPVCGNDGITYSNLCQFSKAQCQNAGLQLKHEGRCKNSENCMRTICPIEEEPSCGSDGKTYRNKCEFSIAKCYDQSLEPISVGPCPDESFDPNCSAKCDDQYRPVCATDGQTYANICFFEKARCKNLKLKIYKFEPC